MFLTRLFNYLCWVNWSVLFLAAVLTFFFFLSFYSDFINIIHNKKHKFILNKHKSQLKFLYKNATLCIFIRTLPPTQNELIERKTIACVWELRHFSFFFFKNNLFKSLPFFIELFLLSWFSHWQTLIF